MDTELISKFKIGDTVLWVDYPQVRCQSQDGREYNSTLELVLTELSQALKQIEKSGAK